MGSQAALLNHLSCMTRPNHTHKGFNMLHVYSCGKDYYIFFWSHLLEKCNGLWARAVKTISISFLFNIGLTCIYACGAGVQLINWVWRSRPSLASCKMISAPHLFQKGGSWAFWRHFKEASFNHGADFWCQLLLQRCSWQFTGKDLSDYLADCHRNIGNSQPLHRPLFDVDPQILSCILWWSECPSCILSTMADDPGLSQRGCLRHTRAFMLLR